MDCIHLNPNWYPEINTERKMGILAKRGKRYDILWGVVHSGNAMAHSIHRTKKQAEEERKKNAYAYVVVKVAITPLYQQDKVY